MRYEVEITLKLVGHVLIEADSPEQAYELADKKYNICGDELPDMDDGEPLEFKLTHLKACKHFRGFDECACNNDEYDLGTCVYEKGIPDGSGMCQHWE